MPGKTVDSSLAGPSEAPPIPLSEALPSPSDTAVSQSDSGTPRWAPPEALSPPVGPAKPVRPFRLGIGLILVMLGAVVALVREDAVAQIVSEDAWSRLLAWTADQTWLGPWVRWLVASVLVVVGGSCLRSKLIFFLIHSALIAGTTYCTNELLATDLSYRVIVLGALVLGYLIHVAPKVATPSLRGIVGLALVGLAGLSTVERWYDWPAWASAIGPNWGEFFQHWNVEFTWGAVLVLTAVGVSFSRNRPIHLLNAVLLAALAYHCVRSGEMANVAFPELGRTLQHTALENVEMWRWVAAVNLVLFAAVLLHMSLGMGSLTLGFAVLWVVVGFRVYGAVGTLSLVRFGEAVAAISDRPGGDAGAMNPLANMGLPIPATAPPTTRHPAPRSATPRSASHPAFQSVATDAELAEARELAIASVQREGLRREVIPLVWMYVIAILAGVIATAGLMMLIQDATPRRFMSYALWFGFGLGCATTWSLWPRDPDQDWLSWLAAFRLSRYHTYPIWLAFLGTTSLLASGTLSASSRRETWVQAAVLAILVGTAATLVASAMLIKFGGLPPLPVWTYCVVAVGQSSMMWALLFHLSGPYTRSHPEGTTA